jgi:energy-coupling factor transport system permease protein
VTGRQRKPARDGLSAVLLRELPGSSFLHRLRAETKMICAAALVLVTLVFPGWPAALVGCAVVGGAAVLARVPPTAIPRPPSWLWIFLLVTAALSFLGNGLARYCQSLLFTVVLLGTCALVTWTTPVSRIAPAVATLTRPLRKLKVPVDEWAITVALCLRSLPLLMEEGRVLLAARRLRCPSRLDGRPGPRRLWADLVDLFTALLAVASRRAGELGQAITARGGLPYQPPARTGISRADRAALAVVALAVAAVAVLSL